MATKREPLLAAAEELKRVLWQAQGLADWPSRLDRALARIEEEVRRRGATLVSPDGLISELDRPRLPSPAVDREEGHLRGDLAQLLEQIEALRAALAGPRNG